MYSLVLATMLTAGSATPSWGHGWYCFGGCGGCWSCKGCHGCYGCHGCSGCSCYGCSCYGCSCWGCSCYGCSCWGCSCYGCSCYGCSCYGCWGCYGCSSCGCGGWGFPAAVIATPIAHSSYAAPAVVAQSTITTPASTTFASQPSIASSPAKVVVQLPPNAELYIDDQKSQLSTETRTVVTPALPSGQDYYYELRVETMVDGKKTAANKRVLLRAGSVAQVDFRNVAPVAANGTKTAPERISAGH